MRMARRPRSGKEETNRKGESLRTHIHPKRKSVWIKAKKNFPLMPGERQGGVKKRRPHTEKRGEHQREKKDARLRIKLDNRKRKKNNEWLIEVNQTS